jgi:hypothetical protein
MSALVQHYRGEDAASQQAATAKADADRLYDAAAADFSSMADMEAALLAMAEAEAKEHTVVARAAIAAAARLLNSTVAAPLPIECSPAAFVWLGCCLEATAVELGKCGTTEYGDVNLVATLLQDLMGLNTGLYVNSTEPSDSSVQSVGSSASTSSQALQQPQLGAGGRSGLPRVLGLLEDSYTAGSMAAQRCMVSSLDGAASLVNAATSCRNSTFAAAGAVGQLTGSMSPAKTNQHTPAAGSSSSTSSTNASTCSSASSSSPGLFFVLDRVAAEWQLGKGADLSVAGSSVHSALVSQSLDFAVRHSEQQLLKLLAMDKQSMDSHTAQPDGNPGSESAVEQATGHVQYDLLKLVAAADDCAALGPLDPVQALDDLTVSLYLDGSTREACTICCGNIGCGNLGTVSELYALVRGRACVCGSCLACGADPAIAKR